MSNRQRILDGSVDSADTAIGQVEDLTPRVEAALLELSDRPCLPTRCPAARMLVGKAGVVVQDVTHPARIVRGVSRNTPQRANLHPRRCQCREGRRQEPTLVMARLRPGIWKKHPDGVDRSRREQPLEA